MQGLWKSLFAIPLVGGAVLMAGPVHARNVLISGAQMNGEVQADLTLLGHTSTLVATADFSATSFSGYDAIWLGRNNAGAPYNMTGFATRKADLLNFVNGGGNLLIELPVDQTFGAIATGDYPLGDALAAHFEHPFGASHPDSVRIVDGASPIMAGLTSADLSGWDWSYVTIFTGIDDWHGVTDTGNDGEWVTITHDYGAGHIVYTGEMLSYHIKAGFGGAGGDGPGSAKGTFVNNVLNWGAAPPPPVPSMPEPGTLALLATGGMPMLLALRRRRMMK